MEEQVEALTAKLAGLDNELAGLTEELRSKALRAFVDPKVAAARTSLKTRIAALHVERDDIAEALAQAQAMADDERAAVFAASQHAAKLARYAETQRVRGEAREAAKKVKAAADTFIAASRELTSLTRHSELPAWARDEAHMIPRRLLRGVVSELTQDSLMDGVKFGDYVDHWDASMGAVSIFLERLKDPVAP